MDDISSNIVLINPIVPDDLVEYQLENRISNILCAVRALEQLAYKSLASPHHDFCEEQREAHHAKRVREEDNGCLCMVCPLLPEKGFVVETGTEYAHGKTNFMGL